MKKDINIPEITDVFVTIAKEESGDGWRVYLLNRNERQLDNVLITSKGYGKKEGKEQKTSTLRHMIPKIEPSEYALIEPIQEEVFHLTNEYWVSFFIDGLLYDKKYIFVPETIISKYLVEIEELGMKGVLHQ